MKWLRDTALGVVIAFTTAFVGFLISAGVSEQIANVAVYQKAAAAAVGSTLIVLMNALLKLTPGNNKDGGHVDLVTVLVMFGVAILVLLMAVVFWDIPHS